MCSRKARAGLVRRPHDPDLRLDLRHRRIWFHSSQPDLQPPGGRLARACDPRISRSAAGSLSSPVSASSARFISRRCFSVACAGSMRGRSARRCCWPASQLIAVPFYGLLANRVDLRWLMMFGLPVFGIGMWSFTPLTHDWGWEELLLPHAFRGFAQQFCVAPIVTLTLGMLPPDRLKSASGLFNLMRNLGGAIGIAACGTILNDRTNLHFQRIAEHLNATNTQAMKFPERGRGALCPDLGRSRSRPWGGAEAALAPGLPRGPSTDLCGCVSGDRHLLRGRLSDGAVHAESRTAEGSLARGH